jgi:Cu/Zn superoxide dismutase
MMPEIRLLPLLAISLGTTGLIACGGATASAPPAETAAVEEAAPIERAIADLYPKTRSQVKGSLVVRDSPEGLSIKGKVKGLDSGSFAVTLHESGDCTAHDAKTVGPVWNPTKADPPVGFIGNATGHDETHEADLDLVVPGITLSGDAGAVGHALVVHAWPMDPAADLSKVPFLACGVIEARDAL